MFIIYTILTTLIEILAFVIVPIAAVFADNDGRLPKWARWYETHDALGWLGPLNEPVTTRSYNIHPKLGLIHYLLRNKAYTFRYTLRAKTDPDAKTYFYGSIVPRRLGPSFAFVNHNGYWEFQPRFGFVRFYLYLRIGWKMMPFAESYTTSPTAGLFIGISIRTDDWEEFGL